MVYMCINYMYVTLAVLNRNLMFLVTFNAHTHTHTHTHIQISAQKRVAMERAIRDFGSLLNDKKVLLVFIRSLEEQRGFSIKDKSTVGSLLMVALHNRLDYATE